MQAQTTYVSNLIRLSLRRKASASEKGRGITGNNPLVELIKSCVAAVE